jgi:hypothetical protein
MITAKPRRRAADVVARGAEQLTEKNAKHLNLRIPAAMARQIEAARAEDPTAPTLTGWIIQACYERLARSQAPR